MPIGKKTALADIVIDNRDSIARTKKTVDRVWRKLVRLEKTKSA